MAHWPPAFGYTQVGGGRSSSLSRYLWTTVTADATAHVKGAWTELIASTPFPIQVLRLVFNGSHLTASDTAMLLDVGTGESPDEKVLIENIACGHIYVGGFSGSSRPPRVLDLPVSIPAGTRIVARTQAIIGSDTISVSTDYFGGMPAGGLAFGGRWQTFGADVATSRGVAPIAGATAHTKGATWETLVSSTAFPIRALAVSVQGRDGALNNATQLTDIGIGGAALEKVLIPDIQTTTDSNDGMQLWTHGYFPLALPIPAGSRLSVRTQSSSALEQKVDWIVHGLG